MATITRLTIDKATVRQLFKAVVKVTDEINETPFIHGLTKRRLKVDSTAQGSEPEFYVLNMFKDRTF
jgi:hypothetical protein